MPDINGNKSGGRKKGTPNKIESKTKIFLKKLMEDQQDKIIKELKSLEGKAYLDVVGSLMEYSQPKLARTEVTAEVEQITRKIGYEKE